jgi:Fuc2NAc and GlcNAc transferase
LILLFVVLSAILASWLGTFWVRQYALARSIMDIPNQRSSHSVPTPRGGGVALVVVSILGLVLLALFGLANAKVVTGICGAGLLVAIVGFWDDHGHVAARWRLLIHAVAAIWGLVWLGGFPTINLLGFTIEGFLLGSALGILFLVWMLNLYNFMDGIDGIAGCEAVTVCAGGALLYWLHGDVSHAGIPLLLAAAVAGFLIWNFPPAKIFMGDAGSGYLGLVLGLLVLQAGWVSSDLLWGWLILLGVFIVDATFTLARRVLRGDKVYEAHRSHGYQYASRAIGRHLPVTLGVLAINLVWLLPLSILVGLGILSPPVGLVVAYLPLVLLAIRYKAGSVES